MVKQILLEIFTNIVKYAEPESNVIVALKNSQGARRIIFVNSIAKERRCSYMTTGMGLPGIERAASSMGGR